MSEQNIFLGQSPQKIDKSKLRIKKPIYLKDSAFAYDLWEWKYNNNSKKFEISSLYYQGMREFINSLDYYKRQLSDKDHIYIKEVDNVIQEITKDDLNDEVRNYVDSIRQPIKFTYNDTEYSIPCETFKNIYLKQHHNITNDKWLTNIQKHEKPILKDTETSSFFVFNNGLIEVTKDNIEMKNLDELKGVCVWKDQVINHYFTYIEDRTGIEGEYEKFIHNVCNKEPQRVLALCSAIGYLLHNHFDRTKGQAVIFYDEALTDSNNPQGGTGKGATVQGIKQMRKTAKIDGKNYKSDDKFKWSNVNPDTQLVWIDETNKNFDFKDMFSNLTDGWQVERKFQNKFDIAPEDSPKVLICSNSILENKGTSNKRRQYVIEFSDFYSSKIITGTEEPIKDEHGTLFSDKWSIEEWNKFYSFMLECSQLYLSQGLCDYERKNVGFNLLKQQTCDEFMEYIISTPPPTNIDFIMKDLFDEFKSCYLGEDSKTTQRTFTNWIKKYCATESLEFIRVGKSNGNPIYQIREQGNKLQ
ncbi:MAG: hypothetical protein JJT77_00865 [Crocinitomicaceae bacterium]|nr:hypothetical protein [Crocinitomicaceae bacterium]